jgi:hypothetical protein
MTLDLQMRVEILLSRALVVGEEGGIYVPILFPIRSGVIDVVRGAILLTYLEPAQSGSPALAAVIYIKGFILQQSTLHNTTKIKLPGKWLHTRQH